MAENTFHISVVTPEREVLDSEARFVAFPSWDGEIGIMRGRAPLLCRVGIGKLRVEAVDDTESRELFIDSGFGQMVDNRLTILTEQARELSDLDRETGREALDEARALAVGDERTFVERQQALQRARLEIRLAPREED